MKRYLLVLLLLGGALTSADEQQEPRAFTACYENNRELILTHPLFLGFVQKGRKTRLQMSDLPLALQEELQDVVLSACLEVVPPQKKRFESHDFAAIMDSEIEQWHHTRITGDSRENAFQVLQQILVEYGLSGVRTPVLRAFYTGFHRYISKNEEALGLEPRVDAEIKAVLSNPEVPNEILPIGFHPSGAKAYLRHRSTLYIAELMSWQEAIPVLFHDACHESRRVRSLYSVDKDDLTDDDWFYLTVQEEFRAVYLTQVVTSAWARAFPGFSFKKDLPGMLESFGGFRASLEFIHDRQKRAVEDNLARYDLMTDVEKETLLASWVFTGQR